VDKYLLPSLLKQGIKEKDIYVYQDKTNSGNLKSWVVSCHLAYDMWGAHENVWHLQDDVLICSDFKERTERLEENTDKIICGFTCKYDDGRNPGEAEAKNHMWYSFPCIRIHTSVTKSFADWVDIYVWRDNQFHYYVKKKKGDDYIFRIYIENYLPKEKVLNLIPNLVEHVDFLLGGTTVNPERQAFGKDVRSMYWEEPELTNKLREELIK
jgi:hypothetical protein